jgi:hypothetical protein
MVSNTWSHPLVGSQQLEMAGDFGVLLLFSAALRIHFLILVPLRAEDNEYRRLSPRTTEGTAQ